MSNLWGEFGRTVGLLLLLIAALVGPDAMTEQTVSAAGDPEPGISARLAADRAARIADVRYELSLAIPDQPSEPIRGSATVRFMLRDASAPVVLDFAQPRDRIVSVLADGQLVPFTFVNGHLVVPSSALRTGENTLALAFIAGDQPLNRGDDFLYSLFVPARASLAVPCFDQPDLKARFTLTLEIPATWQAVANGPERQRTVSGDRATVRFAETQPLPTYLFGFVAGRFSVESAERDGRPFRMFHRETDAAKVARNGDAIFDLHAAALTWLEDYTGIPYPFTKFDFVLIPAFQFGGMEHPGAILYNAPGLLLEETATQDQQLARARVISHETAHMWFGDLVTMKWFDDVWLKEVFANFMAAKIVNPSFPDINHELRFLLAHHPVAYEVDRSAGANPIRQPLDNLNEAGALYGPIIYQKAPVVMRQLERIVGGERFQQGLRDYLRRYAFANASWLNLIALLDERTEEDLAAWSRAWVDEPGRPTLRTELRVDRDGRIARLAFIQSDPRGRQLHWNQQLDVVLGDREARRSIPVQLNRSSVTVPAAVGLPAPDFVLPTGSGMGYGWFVLDVASQTHLLAHVADIDDALTRGSAWVTLWDAMLERQIAPIELLDAVLGALANETDELNVARVLAYVRTAFWRYLSEPQRERLAPRLEAVVREGVSTAPSTSLKSTYFTTYRAIVRTPEGVEWLRRLWGKQDSIPGLTLAENDDIAMATELAMREVPTWDAILHEQLTRIENPDRKARFAFAMPALSANVDSRDRFFASLADPANRRREPWVLDGLAALHHPLRAAQARRYIRPSLDLLREIQRTGDIFFPKRWLDATFSGHNSDVAADLVRDFLDEQTDYPPRLRQIILQSADELFRASGVLSGR